MTGSRADSATAVLSPRETEALRVRAAEEKADSLQAAETGTVQATRADSAETEIVQVTRADSAETEIVQVTRVDSAEKADEQATRADSAETETVQVTRADSPDAALSPDRECAAPERRLQDARVQDPARQKADAADRPAESVKVKVSAEKLISTEMTTRGRRTRIAISAPRRTSCTMRTRTAEEAATSRQIHPSREEA